MKFKSYSYRVGIMFVQDILLVCRIFIPYYFALFFLRFQTPGWLSIIQAVTRAS